MKKLLSVFISAAVILSGIGTISYSADNGETVIIYTNDTHCEVNGELGFADISAIEALETAKGNDVIIVDAGDAVQGGAIGSLSKGAYIIDIMNEIGYDLSAVGNHEFDYTMDGLKALAEMSEHPYICANLIDLEKDTTMFEPYRIINVNDVDIAFIGITTPNTFTSTAPDYFKNDKGEFIYDFSGGEGFYTLIQKNIDNAERDGADILIALTHIGVDDADKPYTSMELIANTSGLDAVIDAHSHAVIEAELHKNKDGEDVLLTSTGSKFDNIGTMRITENGDITTKLIDEEYKADGLSAEAQAAYDNSNAFIEKIKADYNSVLNEIIAVSEYDLTIFDPEKYSEETGAYRMVRCGETNMGDFCADAYRAVLGCDVAIINGGGVRADIAKGDVTYGDVLNVNPFGNDLCVIEVSGTQLLNALEHGARSYPDEEGAFLQVSGLSYEIDPDVKSPVVLDDKGMFKELSGDKRVKNVMIDGKAIDENAVYTLGGSSFTLINGGDGFSMFSGSKVINASVCSDCDALMQYVSQNLGGTIGKEYENPLGDGRIKISSGKESPFKDIENHPAESGILTAVEMELVNGVSADTFEPDSNITRAMFVTILHRLESLPAASTENPYTDVAENDYFAAAAVWANEQGIMSGENTTLFSPDTEITREEIAAAIYRYCIYKNKGPVGMWTVRLDYTDLSEVSEWAVEPLMFSEIHSLMEPDENNEFNPQNTSTRAETIVTVLNTAEYVSAEK